MALVAGQGGMFAFERVSSLLVIEGLDVPLDQRKICAVMFGMAAGALLTRTWLDVVGRMQSLFCRNAGPDLTMALQTFQRALASELVTACAVTRTIQGLMGTGERPGRDLCLRNTSERKDTRSRKKAEGKKMLPSRLRHVRFLQTRYAEQSNPDAPIQPCTSH